MSGKPKVFVSRSDVPASALKLLTDRYEVDVWEKHENIPRDVFLKRSAGAVGVFITSSCKINGEFFDFAGKQLKVVSTMSAGYDHVDLEEAKKRGVKIGFVGKEGVLDDAVAELTVAVLLSRTRRLFEGRQAILDETWKSWVPWTWLNGIGLKDSVVGIIGLGRIGVQIGRRLLPFKIRNLLYTSRTAKKEAEELRAVKVDLPQLLTESDIVIIACTLNDETRNLLSDQQFELMKNSSILVNISRGGVVDQDALMRALKAGKIGGVALDVMTPEPLPKDHELLKMPNCVVIPHLGSAVLATRTEMAVLAASNVIAGVEGHDLPSEIN